MTNLLFLVDRVFLLSFCLQLPTITFNLANGGSDSVKNVLSAINELNVFWLSIAVSVRTVRQFLLCNIFRTSYCPTVTMLIVQGVTTFSIEKYLWHFYLCDAMLVWVFATATCPSVHLSVMRRYCVKTKKASVMISSSSGSPTILVFWCQISSQNSKGVAQINRGWVTSGQT